MNPPMDFPAAFTALTGNAPFPWQQEMYDRMVLGRFKELRSCRLPTGLGKTAVIPIWLIALANAIVDDNGNLTVPRRLVYIVNRRTVVDQSTDEAEKLRKTLRRAAELPDADRNSRDADWDVIEAIRQSLARLCAADHDCPLAISTLRGQRADNAEWRIDPARPAVVVGTVDMIGSRLLFSGYGSGFKSRPLHAGFLGQDALIVHDEAHLEPAFQKLLEAIEEEQGKSRTRDEQAQREGRTPDFRPVRIMELSATSRGNGDEVDAFELTPVERTPPKSIPDDAPAPLRTVWERLTAKKGIEFHDVARDDVVAAIGRFALRRKESGQAILVFVRGVKDVEKVQTILKKGGVPGSQVQVLTGTMRGWERDRMAVEDKVFARFLHSPKAERQPGTVYLVCTSAGEVGVDISADHMICDLTPLDSMAQRLGRVNRRGGGQAEIDLVYETDPDPKKSDNGFEKARWATLAFLRDRLPPCGWIDGRREASPLALGAMMRGLSDDERKAAFSPEPPRPPTSDILFDAWAMTTIRDRLPGRPVVAPYMHGISDDLPRTTIAWRAELNLIDAESPDAEEALQAIFVAHRVRPHETLTTNSYRVIDFFKAVVKKRPDLRGTRIAIHSSHRLRLTTVGDVLDGPSLLNADPTLILPASFGGLVAKKGALSVDAVPRAQPSQRLSDDGDGEEGSQSERPDESPSSTLDIADKEGYEPDEDATPRIRVLLERLDDGWTARALPGGRTLPADWHLDSRYNASTTLANQIGKQSRLNVRLVQDVAVDDEGEPVRALVCLSPALPRKPGGEEQSLGDHVAATEAAARMLADALGLVEPYRSALLLAASWHDEGKKADRWQRYIGGPGDDGEPLGKSARWRDPRLLAGYRHEFGSLLRIAEDDDARRYFADRQGTLTPEQRDSARDLALHMIAAHHGYARPHFVNPLGDASAAQCEETHVEVIQRYARLQRKHGRWGLAYLESLLRAADAAASRALGLDPATDDDDAPKTDGADS